MLSNLFQQLPISVASCILGEWLDWSDIGRLDSACCESKSRLILMDALKAPECIVSSKALPKINTFLIWLSSRDVKAAHFEVCGRYDVQLATLYVESHAQSITSIVVPPAENWFAAFDSCLNLRFAESKTSFNAAEVLELIDRNKQFESLQIGRVSLQGEHFSTLMQFHHRDSGEMFVAR